MMNKRGCLALLGAVLIMFAAGGRLALAASQDKALDPLLSVERIYVQQDFAPVPFGPARWMKDDASYVLLEESAATKDAQDLVLYQAATGRRDVLVPAADLVPKGQDKPLRVEAYEFSADERLLLIFTNSQRVWRKNTRGEFWVFDRTTKDLRRLGGDLEPTSLQFAKFSPDAARAAFVSGNNLYVQDLAGGAVRALTADGSATVVNGTGDWVYEEEFNLRDGFRWSPDGRHIAFWRIDDAAVEDFPLIDNTDSLYPKLTVIKYPKAGEPNPTCRIGVADVTGGGVVWVASGGDPADTYIPWMDWVPGSNEVMLQRMNRLQNTDDVLVARADTGEVRTVLTERDSAWVDVVEDIQWTRSGRDFTWLSERDGWRRAYLVARDGSRVRPLTAGPFDVIRLAALDDANGFLYFYASPDNPTQAYLYRARLDGRGRPERVSPADAPGSHSYEISPTAAWAFHTWSRFDTPPRTELVRLPGHVRVRMLVENRALREKVEALRRSPADFFRVDIGGGVQLDGWCLRPPGFDPARSYPLFFYVYGEPAGQTVLDRWGGDTYLWHLMLAQKGYLVASIDNRGTPAPRGREWRKCIYRRVGILASADQAAATRALIKKWPYVDPDRIGIWGWSGGGSMTLNAILRYPDLYRTGMAVAFVSNQRYYDSIYQERYMGLPRDNPDGYVQGSPITFADQLKGRLLLVHGTGDDNVHYQNCEALVNELIRRDKAFTIMPYPNRSHGIFEGENTTRHLRELLTRFLLDNLPPGPRG
jgi:dipeptidyl-peptidase-4